MSRIRARRVLPGCHIVLMMAAMVGAGWLLCSEPLSAQSTGQPFAVLTPALSDGFPNETDSNSPAVWELVGGQWAITLFNSVAGRPRVSDGPSVRRLVSRGEVTYAGTPPEQGVWFESVVREADAWYAFYHNERAGVVCPGSGKVWPRIGAARSDDRGASWVDLGPVLETPASSVICASTNHYFVGGGVGDLTVRLDPDRQYAYFYYSQYAEVERQVGVAVARMAWADRDAPAGRLDVWVDGAWLPPSRTGSDADDPSSGEVGWLYPVATPILRSANSWDDGRPGVDFLAVLFYRIRKALK